MVMYRISIFVISRLAVLADVFQDILGHPVAGAVGRSLGFHVFSFHIPGHHDAQISVQHTEGSVVQITVVDMLLLVHNFLNHDLVAGLDADSRICV